MDASYDLAQAPAATALAVACALAAAAIDHRRGFIPNALTYPCLLGGLALATAAGGAAGLGWALAGMLAAGGLFFVAFAAGSCGGGDVKLMGALGAILGLWPAVDVTLAALMAGGVLAVGSMLRRLDAKAAFKTLGLFAMLLPVGVRNAAVVLAPRERRTIRFGIAAAAGLLWCLFLPNLTPLSFLR